MKVFRNKQVLDIIVAALSGLAGLAAAIISQYAVRPQIPDFVIVIAVIVCVLSVILFAAFTNFRRGLLKGGYGNYDAEHLWIWELWRQLRDDYFRDND